MIIITSASFMCECLVVYQLPPHTLVSVYFYNSLLPTYFDYSHVYLGSFMKLTGIQNFLLLLSVGGKCRIWVRSHGSNWYFENNKICKWICSHYYYEAFQLWRTEAPSWGIVSLAGTLITPVDVNIIYAALFINWNILLCILWEKF